MGAMELGVIECKQRIRGVGYEISNTEVVRGFGDQQGTYQTAAISGCRPFAELVAARLRFRREWMASQYFDMHYRIIEDVQRIRFVADERREKRGILNSGDWSATDGTSHSRDEDRHQSGPEEIGHLLLYVVPHSLRQPGSQ